MKIIKNFLLASSFMMGSTIASYAKVYCVIEKVIVDGNCKIIVIAWYDDKNTPNNSNDDIRLGTDFLRDCP